MPSVLDKTIESAKEAAYTAVGINVLVLDEINERLAGPRGQVEEQLEIARKHATEARTDWQKQAESLKERLPFDVDAVTGKVRSAVPFDVEDLPSRIQEQFQANARRSWELTEPAMKWIAGVAPAPVAGTVTTGIEKMRELLEIEADEAAATDEAPAEKKAKKAKKAKTETAETVEAAEGDHTEGEQHD